MYSLRMLPALLPTTAIVVGMVASYFLRIPFWCSFLVLAVGVGIGIIVFNKRRWRMSPLLAACMACGALAMTAAKSRMNIVLPQNSVVVEGVVIDTPRPTAKRTLLNIYILRGPCAGKKIRCYVPKQDLAQVHLGETYVLRGRLRQYETFDKRSHFDYRRWADARWLVAQMSVYKGFYRRVENKIDRLPFFERVSLRSKFIRQKALRLFEQSNIAPEHLALVAAMAFGERSMLSQETRDMFSATGVSHLLALSGLHLSILYVLLSWFFRRVGWRSVGSVIIVLSIWLYALLVGMPVSVLRAATMLTIYTLLAQRGRTLSANPLFVTVAILLLCNPLIIWDIGFQMSVISVLSITFFFLPIYRLINPLFLSRNPIVNFFWTLIVASISAQLGVFPLIIYYFGYFSTIFLLSNIIAVPLVTLLLYSVFFTLLFAWLPVVKGIFLWLVRLMTTVLEWCLGGINSLHGVSIEHINISPLQLFLLYGIVAALAVMVNTMGSIVDRRRRERIPV